MSHGFGNLDECLDPSRLTTDSKGDTVQPYTSVNEWNRAVIFFLDRDGGKSQVLESETSNE